MNRLLFFWGLIVVFLLAGCGGGDSNDGAPSNIKKSLQEISIELMETPILGVSTLSVIVGQELSFKAIGKFDDGTIQDLTSSVSWFLDHPESIHINASGRAIGISVGKSTIKANFNGIISNGITIDTISPHLQEITITFNRDNLPIGSLIQAKAIGIYENGITSNITSLVEWSSSLALVSFQKDGLLKPISVGIDVITASYQGIISSPRDIKVTDAIIESISISSKSTKIDKNLTTRFTATAIYSDNTEVDVTNSAKWSSSNVNIATVDNTGLVNAIAVGNANIQASFSGKTSQSVTLNVTAPTLEKLEIITTKRHFFVTEEYYLKAQKLFSNGEREDVTKQVTWTSTYNKIIEIDHTGLMKALATGDSIINASGFGLVSNDLMLTVNNATLTRIDILSPISSLKAGQISQLKVIAVDSANNMVDITDDASFNVSKSNVVSVSKGGVVKALRPGFTTLNVQYQHLTSSEIKIEVEDFNSINIEPAVFSLAPNQKLQLHAFGIYNEGEKIEVTNDVAWSTTTPSSIHLDGDTNGLIKGIKPNSEIDNINATLGSFTAKSTVNVNSTNHFKRIVLARNSLFTSELELPEDGVIYSGVNEPLVFTIKGKELVVTQSQSDIFNLMSVTSEIRSSTYPSSLSAFITAVEYSYNCTQKGIDFGFCENEEDIRSDHFKMFGTRLNFDNTKSISDVYSGEYEHFRLDDSRPISYKITINTLKNTCTVEDASHHYYECNKLSINNVTGEISSLVYEITSHGRRYYGQLTGAINGASNEFITGFIHGKDNNTSIDMFSITKG